MGIRVLSCLTYDTETNTCTEQAWVPQPSFLPVLSVADAIVLGSAIVACWTLAYAFRRLEQVIRQ